MSEILREIQDEIDELDRWTTKELEDWEYLEDAVAGLHDLYRPDGGMDCGACGFTYWQHPFTGHRDGTFSRADDENPHYYLHILCSGDLIKL
jgi:hypothetical protein